MDDGAHPLLAAQEGGAEVITSVTAETREMRYKVDLTKRPHEIDLTPCGFPYTDVLKGTAKGIFELDGGALKIAYGAPGMRRPAAFTSAADDYFFLFILKRESAKKPKPEKK